MSNMYGNKTGKKKRQKLDWGCAKERMGWKKVQMSSRDNFEKFYCEGIRENGTASGRGEGSTEEFREGENTEANPCVTLSLY